MAAKHFNEGLREKLIRYVVMVLWDEKARSNIEIAEELQRRFPLEFFDMNTDLLAQNVYAYVTIDACGQGLMTMTEIGKYAITAENKKGAGDDVTTDNEDAKEA